MLMADGFDAAYRGRRGSKRRAEHRRRMRRLLENGEAEFTIARTIDELRPALEEGFRLNDLRWEGRPDRSLFATPAGHAFHRAVLPRLAQQNLARILLLRSRGRVVALSRTGWPFAARWSRTGAPSTPPSASSRPAC